MTKSALAAQLRVHYARQGLSLESLLRESDDEVISMVAGPCGWCGQLHVYGGKLDQVIAQSLDEKHFRSLRNDYNTIACPTVNPGRKS